MKLNDCFLVKIPIAHRGLHDGNADGGLLPENSYAAFEKAIECGYAIEMDVRLTKDGKIVVFHDDSLERVARVKGKVSSYTYAELQAFSLNGTDQKIPLFSEFLSFIDGRAPLLIEIKNEPSSVGFVESILAELEGYKGEFALQSFNPLYVKTVRKLAPHILRGQLVTQKLDADYGLIKNIILKKMLLNFTVKPHFISYDINYLPCRRAKRKSKILLGWVFKNQSDADRLNGYVDNIIFEGFTPSKKS